LARVNLSLKFGDGAGVGHWRNKNTAPLMGLAISGAGIKKRDPNKKGRKLRSHT